jgi:hypothetical protein
MTRTIAFQESLSPALPAVLGCKDYQQEQQLLERVDTILRRSGLEMLFLEQCAEVFEVEAAQAGAAGERVQEGGQALAAYLRRSREALRCTILKNLTRCSYRELSKALALAPLYRWFCGIDELALIRVPAKSTLRDYAHWLPMERMAGILAALTTALSDEDRAREIGLESELEMAVAWVDTTCLKACIHFPTDWVLLRDAVRTLVKCILTIRRHGLKKRIAGPEDFLRQVNALAMGMSAAGRRQSGAKKQRKKVLRAIKALSKVVERHGQRYRDLLDAHWSQSDLTRKAAEVILRRMDQVLGQLPEARRQAHERIIGERKVANARKILSLYESDIHVIVRGKAGAEVEFGNSLFLAENIDGFIIDHEFKREISPGDSQWLQQRYPGMKQKTGGKLCGVVGDRSFASKASADLLAQEQAYNGITPKDPGELAHRMRHDPLFRQTTKRRAQTEGRIAVLKNVFLGGIPRAKGFANRQLQVAWAVLSHNLWLIARLPSTIEEPAASQAA